MSEKTAVITGGNAGIGLALAERLLEWDASMRICLACRNREKAEEARTGILQLWPTASVDIIILDVSSLKSVYDAAHHIRKRYKHVDYVYLNAGIMPISTINWNYFWPTFFSVKCLHMLRTGDGLLNQIDGSTVDGYKHIFCTNLFGHFILLKEILPSLGGSGRTSQIIWTSSSNAKRQAFNLQDVQHTHGKEPYSSSKYASDLVSVALNEEFNKQGVYSHSTCPGLVRSNITYNILPWWIWYLMFPLIVILRVFTANMTNSPRNGAEALLWCAQQKPETLDPLSKYNSRTSALGRSYTEPTKLDIDVEDATKLYKELTHMELANRSKFKQQ